jgi:CcmD family protein
MMTTTAMTTMTAMSKIMMTMMTLTTRKSTRLRPALGALMLILGLLIAPATALAQQSPAPTQPPAATDQYVPMDDIPEQDKLPAAPYLIGAYMVAWLMLLFYVWSLWRRLGRVEEELKRLTPGSASEH